MNLDDTGIRLSEPLEISVGDDFGTFLFPPLDQMGEVIKAQRLKVLSSKNHKQVQKNRDNGLSRIFDKHCYGEIGQEHKGNKWKTKIPYKVKVAAASVFDFDYMGISDVSVNDNTLVTLDVLLGDVHFVYPNPQAPKFQRLVETFNVIGISSLRQTKSKPIARKWLRNHTELFALSCENVASIADLGNNWKDRVPLHWALRSIWAMLEYTGGNTWPTPRKLK